MTIATVTSRFVAVNLRRRHPSSSSSWVLRPHHHHSLNGVVAAARASHRKIDGNGGCDYTDVRHQPDAHAHPSHAIPDDVRAPEKDPKRKKKPVALLLAYVGRAYRGNTHNAQIERGSTVDDVVEDAMFQWGGILMPNYRSRGLQRLKWSRSSRTDKGVSSLCTVVSARCEIDPDSWNEDAEGRDVAREISEHLPEDVRCFAVYNTPKSFQARRECVMRTYEYLLPARVLDLMDADAGAAERLERFRMALKAFEGAHPFHNYTKRAQYSRKAKTNFSAKLRDARGKLAWEGQEGAVMDDASEAEEDEEEEEVETSSSSSSSGIASDDDAFPKHIGRRDRGTYWLFETDPNDRIGQSHFRRIHNFTCGDAVERMDFVDESTGAVVTSEPFIRISVRGESFMLYQIRKMIATAVAVSLGYIDLEFLPASLARPCRAAMPLAPASTLYLYDVEFMPFRKNLEPNQPNRLDRLVPSDAVRADLDAFRREKLEPALAPALLDEEWDAFKENLAQNNVDATVSAEIIDAYATYKANRDEARAEQERLELESQAAAAQSSVE